MRYLGLDLGSKTLGIALSDPGAIIASPYKIIRHNEEYDTLIESIKEIVEDEKVSKIVLGFPKMMNNDIGPKGELSIKFKEKLEKELNIPVILQDERLTTKRAEDVLISNNTRRSKRKKVIDKMAAVIILQSYLDRKERKNEKE